MNRKTKYSKDWEKNNLWLKPCVGDPHTAKCTYCDKTFSISGSGISQVNIHAKGKTHLAKAKELEGRQSKIDTSDGSIRLSKPAFSLSHTEQVQRAEILEALRTVECNHSFRSANDHDRHVSTQFPDSAIAKSFKQNETKMKYSIQYGIAPYFKNLLQEDLKGVPFCFEFDESTTEQVIKQYDGYVQYWSKRHQQIRIAYCGTLAVDHCPAEKLLEHFLEFGKKVELDFRYMLHVGMDGPAVNLKFEKLLKTSALFKSIQKEILSLGTCPLHIVHNAFRAGITRLEFKIDLLLVDIHFFFKLSAARRKDYVDMEDFTETTSHFVQKHSTTRWVTMKKVCAGLLQQFDNLKHYFITFLPTTPTFKNLVEGTERYNRIIEKLNDPLSVPYIAFVVFVATDFEVFLKMFQSMQSKIHILYAEMASLVRKLMAKFIKARHLFDVHVDSDGNKEKTEKPFSEILNVKVSEKKYCKAIKFIDVGTKAKNSFAESLQISDLEKRFRENCLQTFQVATRHLISKLPFNSTVLEKCQYLDPRKRQESGSLDAISSLATELILPLKGVLSNIFPGCASEEEVIDGIKTEWREYQMEFFPENYFVASSVNSSGRKQVSYWEHAFNVAGITNESNNDDAVPSLDVDALIISLEKKVLKDGSCKFPKLCQLFKMMASIPHGNSAPENGFSINKRMIQLHGTSIQTETIEAIRLVKDTILCYGSRFDIPMTKALTESVKLSHSRYQADLKHKRELKEAEERKVAEKIQAAKEEEQRKQEQSKKNEEKSTLQASLQQLDNGILVADNLIESGNEELKALLLKKTATKKQLQTCQSKIETGVKRRKELVEQKEVIGKRMKEI